MKKICRCCGKERDMLSWESRCYSCRKEENLRDVKERILSGELGGTECEDCQKRFGKISALYADSAEQTLISGLRLALKPLGVIVKNSLKRQINDRIRATTMLMGGGRFFMISEDCGSLINAFKGAVWDDKVIGKEERLDDGTSDIDTLDAFEYSFEKFIPQLIRSEK